METTEGFINWTILLQIGWITVLGLIVHFLDKVIDAKKLPNFSWKTFWNQNLLVYIVSFILCFVGLLLMGSGIDLVPGNTKIVIAFGLGYGGGAAIRSIIKKVTP